MRSQSFIIFFFFSLVVSNSFGTEQISDLLIYKGDTFYIYTNPINKLLPEDPIDDSISNQLLSNCRMSNNAKGYRNIWEIKNDQFFLSEIYNSCNPGIDLMNILEPIVDEEFFAENVFAYWFTGEIIVFPVNDVRFEDSYTHQHFYETEFDFIINSGKVIESRSYKNTKTEQTIYGTNQDSLFTFIYSTVNWELIPILQEPIAIVDFSANEKGEIDQVTISSEWNESFKKEIKRVFKSIPKWNIYYSKEQFVRVERELILFFNEETKKRYSNK